MAVQEAEQLSVKIMKRNVTRVGYIEVYISTTCSSLDGASREQLRTVMRVIVINAVTGNATSISNDIGEDQKLETRIEAHAVSSDSTVLGVMVMPYLDSTEGTSHSSAL